MISFGKEVESKHYDLLKKSDYSLIGITDQ